MDKSGVSKEAQDDALSDDTTGGRQTPTGRPTRGNVAPTTVFYLSFLFAVSGGGDFEFFFKVSHQRESGNTFFLALLQVPLAISPFFGERPSHTHYLHLQNGFKQC